MRKNLFIITLLLLAVSLNVAAQKKAKPTKEEVAMEKAWAKKLKSLKPLDYKKLVEEKDGMVAELRECENSKTSIKSEIGSKDMEIARLKRELEDAKSGSSPVLTGGSQSSQSPTSAASTGAVAGKKLPSKGVVYKVQVGAFKNKDLTKYFDNNPNFSGEVDPDGTKKYTIGQFTDYWEADAFKKALREMGVKGAWVVPYKDGKRVPLKDVLEGAI